MFSKPWMLSWNHWMLLRMCATHRAQSLHTLTAQQIHRLSLSRAADFESTWQNKSFIIFQNNTEGSVTEIWNAPQFSVLLKKALNETYLEYAWHLPLLIVGDSNTFSVTSEVKMLYQILIFFFKSLKDVIPSSFTLTADYKSERLMNNWWRRQDVNEGSITFCWKSRQLI